MVLESEAFQLAVIAVPRKIAASIRIAEPPQRREDAAQLHGGQLNSSGREWQFQNARVCDGQDPEGNVVPFRERVP